jgi:hypothetical protein
MDLKVFLYYVQSEINNDNEAAAFFVNRDNNKTFLKRRDGSNG